MIRLLLDENISPALVRLLADLGVYSQSVPHIGLAGRPDQAIWEYALDHDFAVVTINARDFIELLDTPVHPGLIVLRESGLSRQEQWERLIPVVEHVKKSGDQDFLLNKLIEITGVRQFTIREIPEPSKEGSELEICFGGRDKSVGYSALDGPLRYGNANRFSYNKRTMDSAMGPFLPFWPYEESITYVLSTR